MCVWVCGCVSSQLINLSVDEKYDFVPEPLNLTDVFVCASTLSWWVQWCCPWPPTIYRCVLCVCTLIWIPTHSSGLLTPEEFSLCQSLSGPASANRLHFSGLKTYSPLPKTRIPMSNKWAHFNKSHPPCETSILSKPHSTYSFLLCWGWWLQKTRGKTKGIDKTLVLNAASMSSWSTEK